MSNLVSNILRSSHIASLFSFTSHRSFLSFTLSSPSQLSTEQHQLLSFSSKLFPLHPSPGTSTSTTIALCLASSKRQNGDPYFWQERRSICWPDCQWDKAVASRSSLQLWWNQGMLNFPIGLSQVFQVFFHQIVRPPLRHFYLFHLLWPHVILHMIFQLTWPLIRWTTRS